MATPRLDHWYHVYADGNWQTPVAEHLDALDRFGLSAELAGFHVGFVGQPHNIDAAVAAFDGRNIDVVARSPEGWEQETLDPMWEWCRTFDGDAIVSYAHTKGAANYDPINDLWRRGMEYHNTVVWRLPVAALQDGAAIAGCHWHVGGPSSIPGYGSGGMFGGNYWWTSSQLLGRNVRPGRESRFAAEHWLGQLSEVTPLLVGSTIADLHPDMIHHLDTVPAW